MSRGIKPKKQHHSLKTTLTAKGAFEDIEVHITSPLGGDLVTNPVKANGTVSPGVDSLTFYLVNIQGGGALRKLSRKKFLLDAWEHTFANVEPGYYSLSVIAKKNTTEVGDMVLIDVENS
jgi:hypothetical protein